MPTVLVRDILGQASTLLKDSPQFTRWTQRELVDHLVNGQIVICTELTLANPRRDAVKLAAGTRQSIASIPVGNVKAGDGSEPTEIIRGLRLMSVRSNMGSTGLVRGGAVRGPVDRKSLDAADPEWATDTGSKVHEYLFDPQLPKVFDVIPGVTGSVWVEIEYGALPLAIPNTGDENYARAGDSTQTITIPDEFAPDLVHYVVGMANLKDSKFADKAAAAYHGGQFLGLLEGRKRAAGESNPNLKRWPMQPQPLGAAA